MRGLINTALAQRNAVIAFTGAAEQCSAVQEYQTHRYQCTTDTERIISILKDIRIQEDFILLCLCNIQRQMKESVTGKEAQ